MSRGKRYLRKVVLDRLMEMKGRVALSVGCMAAVIVTELISPWPFKIILDHILLDNPLPVGLSFLAWIQEIDKTLAVVWVSSAILVIAVVKGSASYTKTYAMSRVGHQLVYTVRREMFSHLQRLALTVHHRSRSGEVLTKVTGDTRALRNLFSASVLDFPTYALVMVGMGVVMVMLNVWLSLAVFVTLPVLGVVLFHRLRTLKHTTTRQRRREGKIASRVGEAISSITLLQVFGREKYEEDLFDAENKQMLDDSVHMARVEASAERTIEIINAGGHWVVLLLGAVLVIRGRMTPGDIIVFSSYVSKMYKPINSLVKAMVNMTKAAVSIGRISELFDAEPETPDAADAIEARDIQGQITFDNVTFDYGDGRGVLRDATFDIQPGQSVAMLGSSGAGKSTIASLIPRLFDPQEGTVALDGVDIRRYTRRSLREQIGVVLQEATIIGATIRQSIAYGKLDATDDEIVAAAKAANAHGFITELENGYDTVIGERGATLSGGQRQRLAIARALIRNAPILILDEPMRGLDVESEAKVREALNRLMQGKTCLIITHDLNMAGLTDLIFVLEDGRVIEQGIHQDLMDQNGRYRRLHEIKTATHEPAAVRG